MIHALLCICVISSLRLIFASQALSSTEYAALEDFYDSLGGKFWLWRSNTSVTFDDGISDLENLELQVNFGPVWNFTGVHDPCQEGWQGINCTCSSTGSICSIVVIELINYNLSGTLPSSISNFPNLEMLYLDFNNIIGTIPIEIGSLSQLWVLDMANNDLIASIPYAVGNCSELIHLNLEHNSLTGTIPDSIYQLTNLMLVILADNDFTGDVSTLVGQLTSLEYVDLSDNNLIGLIPSELGNCTHIERMLLYSNLFSGTIPIALERMPNLIYLSLFDNDFTGTIPSWLGTSIHLVAFDAGYNMLSGTIPSTLCHAGSRLSGIFINSNNIVGTIPSCFGGSNSTISVLLLSRNHLTGKVDASFSFNELLRGLFLNWNSLTGTLPSISSPVLQALFIENNLLEGDLLSLFNPNFQLYIQYIDLSNNEFSGTIPDSFYQLLETVSLVLSSNCFIGSISDDICNLQNLEILNLDGLHTANNCHKKILPYFNSFVMGTHIEGTIPSCLFELNRIDSIHISGNAMDFALPRHLKISHSLQNIILSHNIIRGEIPLSLQLQRFKTLDLSYNCFSGVLRFDFNVSDETRLEVNRLSGAVPSSFRHAVNVTILDSNMFSCDLTKSTLPLNDPEYSNFACGSNAFNQALTFWVVAVLPIFVIVLLLLYLLNFSNIERYQWCKAIRDNYHIYVQVYKSSDSSNKSISDFGSYMERFRWTSTYLTLIICLILLPLYCTLRIFYSSYSHTYAWGVSAVYLSGRTPAIILMLVYISFISLVLILMGALLWKWLKRESVGTTNYRNKLKREEIINPQRFLVMCVIAVLDCSLMLALNAIYVHFVFEASNAVLFICQWTISMVKIFWNEWLVVWMLRAAQKALLIPKRSGSAETNRIQDAQDMPVMTFIVIFNSVIAPVIANSILSKQCYQRVFFPPKDTTSYSYFSVCQLQLSLGLATEDCSNTDSIQVTTSYHTPFIYRYGCSSSFINHYAAVFVYSFLLMGVGRPLGLLICKILYMRTLQDPKNDDKSYFVRFLKSLLMKLLKEDLYGAQKTKTDDEKSNEIEDYKDNKDSKDSEEKLSTDCLFRKERFVLNNISATCVLLTVGVIFPPVAVVTLFAIFSHTWSYQLMIGRFPACVVNGKRDDALKSLNRDCEGVAVLFKHSLYFLMPFVACFYGFFLIDIYGDESTWRRAIWVAVIILLTPLFSFVAYKLMRFNRAFWNGDESNQENSAPARHTKQRNQRNGPMTELVEI